VQNIKYHRWPWDGCFQSTRCPCSLLSLDSRPSCGLRFLSDIITLLESIHNCATLRFRLVRILDAAAIQAIYLLVLTADPLATLVLIRGDELPRVDYDDVLRADLHRSLPWTWYEPSLSQVNFRRDLTMSSESHFGMALTPAHSLPRLHHFIPFDHGVLPVEPMKLFLSFVRAVTPKSTDDQETLELNFAKEVTEPVQAPADHQRSQFSLLRTVSQNLRLRNATWSSSKGKHRRLPLHWVSSFNTISVSARFLKETVPPYLDLKDWLYAEALLQRISVSFSCIKLPTSHNLRNLILTGSLLECLPDQDITK
jgi:hypothetical protein